MNQTTISNPFDEDEKSGRQPIAWAILGLTVMCCGLGIVAAFIWFKPDVGSLVNEYFPSPTASRTSTPSLTPTLTLTPTRTPTPTPNATATAKAVQATDTAIAQQSTAEYARTNWMVVLTDTFDSNSNNWLVEENDDEYALTNYEIVDGKYRWDATAHKSFIGWVRNDRQPFTDFYLSVDVQQMEGPNNVDYGVIFREDPDSNFYYFGINDQGEYTLLMLNEEWNTLRNWTRTSFIEAGGVNRITVIGEGSHFSFFINGQFLMEITDDTLPSGSAALAIELLDADDHAVIEFDNLEIREP